MNVVIGEIVFLQPLKGACNRTKNRIAQHGKEGFQILRFDPGSQLFGGTPAVLMRSESKTAKGGEEWFGWLPLLEIGEHA